MKGLKNKKLKKIKTVRMSVKTYVCVFLIFKSENTNG